MAKCSFIQVSNAKIAPKRNAVISKKLDDNSFTIGQQIEVTEENGKTLKVFLKGALHVDDIEGLQNLRDAINVVLNENK